jgi:hypothetical protein
MNVIQTVDGRWAPQRLTHALQSLDHRVKRTAPVSREVRVPNPDTGKRSE